MVNYKFMVTLHIRKSFTALFVASSLLTSAIYPGKMGNYTLLLYNIHRK